jgi:hypothetical protein
LNEPGQDLSLFVSFGQRRSKGRTPDLPAEDPWESIWLAMAVTWLFKVDFLAEDPISHIVRLFLTENHPLPRDADRKAEPRQGSRVKMDFIRMIHTFIYERFTG